MIHVVQYNLKRNHSYYYQCPLQLFVTQRLYCDFVVWTQQDIHIERITKDEVFLQEKLPYIDKFFNICILPELLGKWFTRSHSLKVPCDVSEDTEDDTRKWCYCQESKGEEMICCDNKKCGIGWYHLDCLQMGKLPKGKWLCPTCHASSTSKGTKKKEKQKLIECAGGYNLIEKDV